MAQWYVIYIREAHPADGWQVDANVEEGIEILQPQSMEERLSVARDFVADSGLSIPLLVDGIDNQAARDYKGWPDRIYIVGEDGKVILKGEQGPWGFIPMETIPQVLDTMTGMNARGEVFTTWGTLKASF